MDPQQIGLSGLGGQGVLFITRILAETALGSGLDVLSSETHGMAMRGGAVISHLKVGPFHSPLIRAGRADLALFLAEENLEVHPYLIGTRTRVIVNSEKNELYEAVDAGRIAEASVGRRQAVNLVLLGYVAGKGYLFAGPDDIGQTIEIMSRNPRVLETNRRAFEAGLALA